MLSPQAVAEYQQIYQKVYKESLSIEEAKEQATNLISLILAFAPIKPNQNDNEKQTSNKTVQTK